MTLARNLFLLAGILALAACAAAAPQASNGQTKPPEQPVHGGY